MSEHVGIRWQCRRCGRFVPESAVQSEDYRDPDAYYGIISRTWVDCPRCGVVDNPGVVLLGDDGPPDDGHRREAGDAR